MSQFDNILQDLTPEFTTQAYQGRHKYPVLNQKYELTKRLDEGYSSVVYECRSLSNPDEFVVLKLLKLRHLKSPNGIYSLEKEIEVQSCLSHKNICKILIRYHYPLPCACGMLDPICGACCNGLRQSQQLKWSRLNARLFNDSWA